jgi:hypothetical protein
MEDHRQAIRWRANWQAKIRLEAAESGAVKDFTNCLIYDITLRGLRVCLPEKMEVDTSIEFSLVLCEDCHLENLEAWVARFMLSMAKDSGVAIIPNLSRASYS